MDVTMSDIKGYNKRMSDQDNIPEMNGTIKSLVELIASPMDTPTQQAQALRESIKVQLHTYIMQKQLLEAINELLSERKGIISRLIDKALVPFIYFVGASILWLIATHLKP
jgi:hypothetical protein